MSNRPRGGPPPPPTSSCALSVRPSRRPRRAAPLGSAPQQPGPATATGGDVAKPHGQLCPICRDEHATEEIRVGAFYTKICTRCLGSGLHVMKLLGRLL